MRHGIVTIVAPIAAGRDLDVRDRLRALDDQRFGVVHGLHFASLSVIDNRADRPDDPAFAPHLVFEASFDGTREDFIDDLVALLPDTVDEIYRDCDGYSFQATELPQLVKNYLFDHDCGADTLYIGYPGRTVGQITQEDDLHGLVVGAFDGIDRRELERGGAPPPMQRSLLRGLRGLVSRRPDVYGALTLPERPFVVTYGRQLAEGALRIFLALAFLGFVVGLYREFGGTRGEILLSPLLLAMATVARVIGVWRPRWKRTARFLLVAAVAVPLFRYPALGLVAAIDWATQGLIVLGLVAVGLALVIAVGVIAWICVVQILEWIGPEPTPPHWDHSREEEFRRCENRGRPQNHMVGLNRIKPTRFGVGWFTFRWLTLRIVLWTIHVSKHLEKSGLLSGVSSIHFARWVIIDRHRQVLFLSHYDGDWDAYLGDFVAQASSGLTAIWSNCVGFPRAYFLFGGGARDERGFKAYARNHQHETLCLYSAYPHLTVADIEKHTAIREALGTSLDEAGVDALIGSI